MTTLQADHLDGLGTALAVFLLILLLGRVYTKDYAVDTRLTYERPEAPSYQPHPLRPFDDLFPTYFSAGGGL